MIGRERNYFSALVEDKISFIEYLLSLYPLIYKEWLEKEDKHLEKIAKDYADNDKEIEASTLSSLREQLYFTEETPDLYYQALLILSYSHFESSITALAKKCSCQVSVDAICETTHHDLSSQSRKALDFIRNRIRTIRNNIVHNNFGTIRQEQEIIDITKDYQCLIFDGESITIVSPKIIEDTLQKLRILLRELNDLVRSKFPPPN